MASTTPSLHKEAEVSSSEATMNTPPILRLPVELRDIIYSYVTLQPPWPSQRSECACDEKDTNGRCPQHYTYTVQARGRLAYRGPLPERQCIYLTTSKISTNDFELIYASPLSRTNKQLRAEFSRFLCTAPLRVVAKVQNFDFKHVRHFLTTLEETHQDAFRVRHDGTSARTLIIELHGPYTAASLDNLGPWIEHLQAFVGSGQHAELASLYTIGPVDYLNYSFKHATNPLTKVHQKLDGGITPGGGEVEAYKIVATLNASQTLWTHFDWCLRWGDDFQYCMDKV